LNFLKLFKLTFQSYVKKIKKVNLRKKLSLFKCVNSHIRSHYHGLSSYLNYIMELKPSKQRWGRW